MKLFTNLGKGLIAGALALSALTTTAAAEYPEKPVTMIIPLGAGGSHDLNARVIASILPTYLGQPVIVKLMPGASGQTGTAAAANSAADGYTILFTQNFIDQLQQHVAKLPYDPNKDFVTVARTNFAAPSVIVKSDSEFTDFNSMLEYGKANPGKLRFGHSGNWGAFMVPGALLFTEAGVRPTLVPHKGGGPALQALLAGDVDVSMAFNSVIDSQGDALRPLVSVSPGTAIEGVPTTGEVGIEGVGDMGIMHRVVLVPAGVPDEALAKLRSAFAEMQDDKTYKRLLGKLGENAEFMDGEAYDSIRLKQSDEYKALVDGLASN
ncbi:tripartite tricarboxylate transporter substrate binding protein [Roseibium sp. MMSF_3544]|uniref:Bug family tripartite tricarboxylate transporter substrate binding protein n=1 Tax=unclassified Roseibium TaxID=2629323 RepID=UPI00273D1D17|nr:tripartite tricarboxylate transporter substrate binding protein [Roseibium sp. MMSF_3544]